MNIYRTLAGLRTPPVTSADVDPTEEATAEVDEPPEQSTQWPQHPQTYIKAVPHVTGRRESLLTRQLHSETEHSEEEHAANPRPSISGSIWSTNSVASTAELTSDDGKSVPSPAVSPPLAATFLKTLIPSHHNKPLDKKVEIVGQEDTPQKAVSSETSVEAGLGRRRCITFACGNKIEKPKVSPPTPAPAAEPAAVASPPKRKSMIQFVCPNRPTQSKASAPTQTKRATSPPPSTPQPHRRSSQNLSTKTHRGSDSTLTNASPKSSRKSPAASATTPTPRNVPQDVDSDDSGPESTRFHEFETRDVEHEGWIQESTVHRSRLTISDTLRKENVIRRACEEVEEEAIEDDEDDIDDLADADDLEDDDLDNDDRQGYRGDVYRIDEESEDSDDGFHSDNEEGFADSDSDDDGEDSDYEWWKPGGPSTAATSVEHLDRLSLAPRTEEDDLVSSVGSVSSGRLSPRMSPRRFQKATSRQRNARAVSIPRAQTPELPDSTDFVAGTLDEDRPLEQAYINNMKDRAAAKHRARPQDIDPTFPTSDPEIDDEDDDDLIDAPDSDNEQMMHGDLEELDGEGTVRARRSPRPSRRNTNRSPAPPTRLRSPPPPARLRSPPPPTRLHSPPPKRRTQHTSPPPSRQSHAHSPRRLRSPAPPSSKRTTPSNTRPGSPVQAQHMVSSDTFGLPQRHNVTHTASLPRGGPFRLNNMVPMHSDDDKESESTGVSLAEAPKRGAIDIYKGLERKRQRRKEKLYQKLCAKAAAKGEKAYKVKPGKGAERMREVGLELQRYKGKGDHILSV